MIEAVRRQQAATLTVARFRGAALVYGKNDCVRLGAFVLRKMGHKVKLAQAGSYKSMRGARRALAGRSIVPAMRRSPMRSTPWVCSAFRRRPRCRQIWC